MSRRVPKPFDSRCLDCRRINPSSSDPIFCNSSLSSRSLPSGTMSVVYRYKKHGDSRMKKTIPSNSPRLVEAPSIGLLCDPHDKSRGCTSPPVIKTVVRAVWRIMRHRSDVDLEEGVMWTDRAIPREGSGHRACGDSPRWRDVYALTVELDPSCPCCVRNGINYDREISAEALTLDADVDSN